VSDFSAGTWDVIVSAAGLIESSQGTVGIKVEFKGEPGIGYYRTFMTPKTKPYLTKWFAEFGVGADEIPGVIADGLKRIVGQPAKAVFADDTYNNKTTLKCIFLNGPNRAESVMKPASHKAMAAAARLFSGELGAEETWG